MTKTFKLGIIYALSALSLMTARLLLPLIPMSDNIQGWVFSIVLQIGLLFGLSTGVYFLTARPKKGDWVEDFCLSTKVPKSTYLFSVLLGVLLFIFTIGVSMISNGLILPMLGYNHSLSGGTIYGSPEILIMEILTTACLPAFCEEYVHRGLLTNAMKGINNEKTVIILMALLFGLGHQSIVQAIYATIGGLMFALLAIKLKSIWPGVIIHFMNNFLAVMCDYSTQKGLFLGKVYSSLTGFFSQNLFAGILIWAGLGYLIFTILKVMLKPDMTIVLPQSESPVATKEPMKDIYSRIFGDKTSQTESKFNVKNVFIQYKKDETPEPEVIVVDKPAEPVILHWSQHLGIIFALTFTSIMTLFTFIWGLMR